MPFFSSKKKDEKKGQPTTGAPAYPVQPSYPVQQQFNYGYQNQPGAPPPYSPYPVQQQPQMVVHDQFEAGARFGHGSQPIIPPPPPGCLPNMAQVASAQGQTVVMGQRPQTFWDGTGGGHSVLY